MWQLLDEKRKQRRLSHLAVRDAVYTSALRREQQVYLSASLTEAAYRVIGGHTGRASLITWIYDAAAVHRLRPSTVFLAADFLDRTLSEVRVVFSAARHIAAACVLLAVKLDEVGGDAMELPGFLDVPNIARIELKVLQTLKWNLAVPTAFTFLAMYCDRFWIPPSALERALVHLQNMIMYVDSRAFYPSTLAYICILLLERDQILPEACKALIMENIRKSEIMVKGIEEGLKRFNFRCPIVPMETTNSTVRLGSIEEDSPSSTTAYPSSQDTSHSVSAQDPMFDVSETE